jgi:acetyl-CoA acyltransferase 2
MSAAKKAIYIVGAKRTAFGGFGGKLKSLSATDLAVISSKAAIEHAKLPATKIDETYFGNVITSSLDAAYLSRHVALKSGLPIASPSLTINRLCGSGFEAACLGAEAIELGRSSVTLCGGTENMSQAPMAIDGLSARFGTALGKGLKAEDTLWAGLTDSFAKAPMGITAENLAEKYKISRKDCDEFGLRSQQLWAAANKAGVFDAEIIPIEIKGKKGPESMKTDEHPRPTTVIEDLTKLKPVFKENGTVTAGTASGICDGSASMLIASKEACAQNNLTPLTRLVSWSRVGCEPTIMGIGPVEAIRNALKAAGLTLADMDFIEINEAFAAQFLACEKELGFDRAKANVHGGAIALGHPLGASGARILVHLTHTLTRTGKRYAVGAACIGGGQGIAVVLENASFSK